jgi:hypothetical protein
METITPFNKNNQETFRTEQLRRFGDAYVARHNDALDIFCDSENPTLEKLCDIFWQSGVIGRLAPADHEEAVARRTLGKDVFDGSEEDPELFWRLLYVCAQINEFEKTNVGARSTWLARPIEFTVQKLLNTDSVIYNELFSKDGKAINPDFVFIKTVKERAIAALEKLEDDPHLEPIPVGASVSYKGIKATVHGYTADGLIVLHAADRQDHLRLVKANPRKGCAVLASEIA